MFLKIEKHFPRYKPLPLKLENKIFLQNIKLNGWNFLALKLSEITVTLLIDFTRTLCQYNSILAGY